MIINEFLNRVKQRSSGFGNIIVVFPTNHMNVFVEMMDEEEYETLKGSPVVKSIRSDLIVEGIAHNVNVVVESDSGFELTGL